MKAFQLLHHTMRDTPRLGRQRVTDAARDFRLALEATDVTAAGARRRLQHLFRNVHSAAVLPIIRPYRLVVIRHVQAGWDGRLELADVLPRAYACTITRTRRHIAIWHGWGGVELEAIGWSSLVAFSRPGRPLPPVPRGYDCVLTHVPGDRAPYSIERAETAGDTGAPGPVLRP